MAREKTAQKDLKKYWLPGTGTFVDLTRSTLYVFKDNKYIPIPDVEASKFRSEKDIEAHYGDPTRDRSRCPEVDATDEDYRNAQS